MCGRYALGIRASFVRYQLQQQGLPVNDAPEDDEVRETYNFPPGALGLVYRADVPDTGFHEDDNETEVAEMLSDPEQKLAMDKLPQKFSYQLKAMKWGLVPFWTKRSPDYGSLMRTINCRDDSLSENRGMWNTMKQKKRCVIVAQGFYEWLKKGPGGKEKIPHFVKRPDEQLICFAGLWDCVKYEDSNEKLYSYAIITTDSNKQLRFLHDRMPVILEPNSKEMNLWLDPTQNRWSSELQSILRPYDEKLDCYPVNKDVGKVGNNSPDFIVPVDSKENKSNIANFFGSANKTKSSDVEYEECEDRKTEDHSDSENRAPMPVAKEDCDRSSLKRKREEFDQDEMKKLPSTTKPPVKQDLHSKTNSNKKTRDAISNKDIILKTSPVKAADGSQRITNFFGK